MLFWAVAHWLQRILAAASVRWESPAGRELPGQGCTLSQWASQQPTDTKTQKASSCLTWHQTWQTITSSGVPVGCAEAPVVNIFGGTLSPYNLAFPTSLQMYAHISLESTFSYQIIVLKISLLKSVPRGCNPRHSVSFILKIVYWLQKSLCNSLQS